MAVLGSTTFWQADLLLALRLGSGWDAEWALRFTMSLGEISN